MSIMARFKVHDPSKRRRVKLCSFQVLLSSHASLRPDFIYIHQVACSSEEPNLAASSGLLVHGVATKMTGKNMVVWSNAKLHVHVDLLQQFISLHLISLS